MLVCLASVYFCKLLPNIVPKTFLCKNNSRIPWLNIADQMRNSHCWISFPCLPCNAYPCYETTFAWIKYKYANFKYTCIRLFQILKICKIWSKCGVYSIYSYLYLYRIIFIIRSCVFISFLIFCRLYFFRYIISISVQKCVDLSDMRVLCWLDISTGVLIRSLT